MPRFVPEENTELRLRLTPYAWEKLLFMRDSLTTEVSGLAIADANDLLLVHDILIPRQEVTAASTKFDRSHLAELTAELADPEGEYKLRVDQFMRVWIHTHPGMSPTPSPRDVETFYSKADFGAASWGVMLILGSQGRYHCAYRFTDAGGKNREVEVPVVTAEGVDFPGVDEQVRAQWAQDISERVTQVYPAVVPYGVPGQRHVMRRKTNSPSFNSANQGHVSYVDDDEDFGSWYPYYDPFDKEPQTFVPPKTNSVPPPPVSTPKTEFTLRQDSAFYLMAEEDFLTLMDGQEYEILPDTMPESVIGSLERCNIHVVDVTVPEKVERKPGEVVDDEDDESGELVFQHGENYYTGADIFKIDTPKDLTPHLAKQLELAESMLLPIAEERSCQTMAGLAWGVVRLAEVVYDGMGTRISEVFHWVTQRGIVILVSRRELQMLEAVAAGRIRPEACNFGIPVSERVTDTVDTDHFYPPPLPQNQTVVDDDILLDPEAEFDAETMSQAWESVVQALTDDISYGIALNSQDSRLVELGDEAAENGWSAYYNTCHQALRESGYSASSVGLDDLQALFETRQAI